MFSRIFTPAAIAAALLLPRLASAQVAQFVDCNPMEEDNCPPNMALGTSHDFNFNTTANRDLWETVAGTMNYDPETGARFQIARQGESTTLMSKFYFFWGRVELHMRCAHGQGIVSSVMLLSDTLDEIDWEILGSNDTHASTNFFGKGVEDYSNGAYHAVGGLQDDFHNYTIMWTEERLEWFIDGNMVRTLLPRDANNTEAYPQTPMRLSMGIWAGGDPTLPQGVRDWAGGDTNYDDGPFYMYVRSAQVSDFSSGKEYVYQDRSGHADSVEVVEGESESVEIINRPPPEPEPSLSDRWNALPEGARIGVYAGSAAFGGLLIFAALFYIIRQRRRGAAEAKLAEQRAERERLEMNEFKAKGIDPDSFTAHGHEYKPDQPAGGGILGGNNAYSAVPESPRSPDMEKSFGAAGAAGVAGVAAGAGAMRARSGSQSPRSPVNNPFASYEDPRAPPSSHSSNGHNPFASYEDHRSPSRGGLPPASPVNRTPSPGSMRSTTPGMPPPQGPLPPAPVGHARMGSPGPNRMNSPGPNRMNSPGPNRMNSPGPGRMNSPGPNRMNSPGPGGPPRGYTNSPGPGGPPRGYTNSPGPQPPRGNDYWNQQGGYQ